jgi:hypothetical protein
MSLNSEKKIFLGLFGLFKNYGTFEIKQKKPVLVIFLFIYFIIYRHILPIYKKQ